MIDKIKNKYYLICDICGESLKFDSWDDAIEYKRANNWINKKITKDNNEIWIEYCNNCSFYV